MVGKAITWSDAAGTHSGTVTSVTIANGTPKLRVGQVDVPMDDRDLGLGPGLRLDHHPLIKASGGHDAPGAPAARMPPRHHPTTLEDPCSARSSPASPACDSTRR
jgi:hypothetical protein